MKWKRILGWAIASLLTLLMIAIIGGYFILRSDRFQQYALHQIATQAEHATGAKTEVGGLDFSLSHLTAQLRDITLHGTEASGQPPLLHVDKLTVSLKIVSVLRQQVNLRQLLIEHPVVYLRVDKDGKTNLPTPPSSAGSSASIFDLAVRHAQITNGEVNYNDRKTPLDADLHELAADVRFAVFAKRYDGELSYKDGHVRYAQYTPLAHNLNLAFGVDPERVDLKSANLQIGSSNVNAQATMKNYANPIIDGSYTVQVHTQDFAQMAASVSPAGDLALTGRLHYQSVAHETALRGLSLDGRVASDLLSAAASRNRIELRKLQGSYELANGSLRLTNVSVESLGGRIMGNAEIAHIDATPDSDIEASLENISLKALQKALGVQQIRNTTLAGTVGGRAEASWKGAVDNIRAHSDLTIQARAAGTPNAGSGEVPINGTIHASFDGPGQTIELRDTTLELPSTTITAQGKVSNRSNLQVQIVASDLHQTASLASAFGIENIPAISGTATLSAQVHGSVKKPEITAQLKGQNLAVQGSEWTSVQASVQADPSKLVVQNALLVSPRHEQATLSANIALRNWSYDPSDSIKANLDVQRMRITDLLQLANQHYPVSGELSANLKFDGSQLNPGGAGSARIINAQVYGEPIQNLTANFQGHDGTIASTLNATANAGAVDANLSYTPKTKAYNIRMNAPAVIMQKLQTVQTRNLGISGTVTAAVMGQGTLDDPQLVASVEIPELQIKQNSIGNLKTELHVAQHAADFTLDSTVVQSPVHARGHVALDQNYSADATIDTGAIPLQVLLATYAPSAPQGVQGQAELHATLKGPLKDMAHLEAHVSVPVLNGSYQSLQIGIAQPVKIDYADSVVTLQPFEIKGTDTSLRIQGRVPLAGGSGSPTLTAQGSADLRILQIVDPDYTSAGTLSLDVRATGTSDHPSVQGQMQLKDVSFNTASAPVGIANLNGTIDISNDRLQFTKMTGAVGGGQVSLGGSVTYRPDVQFNLALQAKSVRLLYPDGLRSLLEANLAFGGTPQASTLSGRVLVNRLSFTQDFDLSKFADQFSGSNALAQPGFADTVKLAIAVQSQDLNATSSQVSLSGIAALQVGGTAADPVITGRTTLTSGELFYRNVRYQLQNGIITFDNPTETHPVLNVSATTTVEQYNLTLGLRGPLDRLATTYTSDPPLATADIINLIARGKTTQESAAQSTSTDSMIASQAASEVSGSLQKLAGISSLSIDPTLGGNGQSPSTQIAIQQRVTKNLLFTFSTDVSQPGSEIVQGEYQLNKQWSVSVARDQLGGFSADGKYHKRF
jgi:translocation and assembly module TamB